METYFDYLRAMAHSLGERIVQTYPALQSPKDLPAPELRTLLRKPLPAQALAITGLATYLKTADPRELSLNAVQGRPSCRWARCMSTPARGHTPLS